MDYRKAYNRLFNSITDILGELEESRKKLIIVQQEAEDILINSDDTNMKNPKITEDDD